MMNSVAQHNIVSKRKRDRSTRPVSMSSRNMNIKAFYCMAIGTCIIKVNQSSTFANAFVSPGSATRKENTKCDGPICPRQRQLSTSLHTGTSFGTCNGRSSKKSISLPGNLNKKSTCSGETFVMRMAAHSHSHEQDEIEFEMLPSNSGGPEEIVKDDELILERRKFLGGFLSTSSAAAVAVGIATTTANPANAFENAYPVTLDFENNDSSINLQSIREKRISVEKAKAKQSKNDLLSHPLSFRNTKDVIGSAAWGGALWLLLGSRSNPLVRPIANSLYDTNTRKGAWVKDRNDGLFAEFPLAFTILMWIVFLVLGIVTDRTLLLATEGDSNIVLQLAGVTLIGGASLEIGRIASGEKMKTREEYERDENLAREFQEYTAKKLIYGEGGSVHRSEVINTFRRYYAKYRVDNDQFPLNDLEIEQLLRKWNRTTGNQEKMSGSGFLKNVKLNENAQIRM